ncbi:CD109 antigen-like [Liolophura sinensis]|uniref:CD109 antigen-like n=1 Tax=Liolophura sinensis TaxID=3198878 RepID=UPI0031583185
MRYLLAALLVTVVNGQNVLLIEPPIPNTQEPAAPNVETLTFDSYLVGVPSCIRPGLSADVYVAVLKGSSPTNVIVELITEKNSSVAANRSILNTGKPEILSIQVPSDITQPNLFPRYFIRVVGTGEDVKFQNQTEVRVNRQNVTGFVQTDKAIYKPGDTVNYRIFSLFPDLKVHKASYDIEIKDPKGNKIRNVKNVFDPSGLVRDSLKLSDEPVLGDWQIRIVETGASSSTIHKSFEVEETVLPRFEVTVIPPSFASQDQETVDVTVTGIYTFGDDVRGTLSVSVKSFPWWKSLKDDVQPVLLQTVPDFVGRSTFTFRVEDLRNLTKNNYLIDFEVEATLRETLTGSTVTESKRVTVYQTSTKVEYVPENSRTFKPGLDYSVILKVSQQDGTAVNGPLGNLTLRAEFTHQVTHTAEATVSLTQTNPPNSSLAEVSFVRAPKASQEDITGVLVTLSDLGGGIFKIDIPTVPEHAERLSIVTTYQKGDYYWYATRAYSPSNSFLQMAVSNAKPKTGDTLAIQFRSTVETDSFSILVSSRGRVVRTYEETRPVSSKTFTFSFDVTSAMAPRAKVVAFFRTQSGEIVADALEFFVQDPFETKVSVGFSAEEVNPGDDVTMTVLTAPNSLVATLVVDKKVLLLKSGNDITESQVTRSISGLDCGYLSSVTDAEQAFRASGFIVLTDSVLHSQQSSTISPRARISAKKGGSAPFSSQADFESPGSGGSQLEELRTLFPETWLFGVEVANSRGEVNIRTTAPDSITSWQATAFAINDQTGFGVSKEPAKLTVVKPFFANIYLPYSVIRGEELFLQVNVFNNLKINLTVDVELQGSDSFRTLDISDTGVEVLLAGTRSQTLIVPSGIPKSVVFPIKAVKLGNIPITVTARSGAAFDGLTKTLLVEPEGVADEYNFIQLVNLTSSSQYQATSPVSYPPGVVQGSEKLRLKLVGDVLGGTVSNLAGLVRMSYGCGEQNMVNFAPTVFVSTYLQSVGQLTGERRRQAIDFISQGFQRQMNYRRNDGSYSAFGNRDKEGNLWLTAFVAKSFVAAANNDFLNLDPVALRASYAFIAAQQNVDGSFRSKGILHSKRLQGQSGGGDALTAYVLTALLENPSTDTNFSRTITKAQRFVENYVNTSSDLYDLAIGAYALALSGSPQADSVLKTLEARATNRDGYTYWEVEAEPVYLWEPPRHQSKAASIEATSYVCLVYALKKDISKSSQCLAWLVSQQNDYGGFVSTQDTVVAIQALSAMGPFFYTKTQDGSVTVEAAGTSASLTVNDANRLELQQATLPVNASSVTVRASGMGVFLVSISVRYHIQTPVLEPSFTLTTTLIRDTPAAIELSVCAKYLRGEASSMANIEIRLPSDFSLTQQGKDQLLSVAKRVDVLDGKVLMYLDEITSTGVCTSFTAIGSGNVNKPKPNPVRVFDYYNPDDSALSFYTLSSLNGNFCDSAVCANDSAGCSANCPKRRRK